MTLLDGPPPPWPQPIDRLLERWHRFRPRVRVVIVAVGVTLWMSGSALQAGTQFAQWGGDGVTVYRATRTLPAGSVTAGQLETVRLPAAAVPSDPVTTPPDRDAPLALPLVNGAILTETHLAVVGPSALLEVNERAVLIPVERGSGIEGGSVVDVWSFYDDDAPTAPLTSNRPVLSVTETPPRSTALVAVPADIVAAITTAVAHGQVVLTISSG